MEKNMKKTGLYICSAIGLVMVLMVSAQAQYKVHIPFDFSVGKTDLKAGDYVINLTSRSSSQQAVTIRETKNGVTKIVLMVPKVTDEMADISKLIFNRYKNQYFLAAIMTPTIGAEFRKIKQEMMFAKSQKQKQTTLAMTR
jgi:hypothetical protein